jgi:paraquat-inducible protein A
VTRLAEPGIVPEQWRECPDCGLISVLPLARGGAVAACPRCGHVLQSKRSTGLALPLACAISGALLYAVAIIAPFLEIMSHGQFRMAQLESGPGEMMKQGWVIVGFVVLLVTVVTPGIQFTIIITTLVGLRIRRVPRSLLREIFRWYVPLLPWTMVDVYMLGILVAYTRLAVIAFVHLDTALYALIGLMLVLLTTNATLNEEAVWQALDHGMAQRRANLTSTARQARLIACESCNLLNHALPGDTCRRCAIVLDGRKPASLMRTWAYVIAAALLYLPSNIYPVMTIGNFLNTQNYTIMGGILELYEQGLWPLAMLVFFASFLIPIMKLLGLGYMLILTHRGSDVHLYGRTVAYRIVDFIGRWSMIDVFMVSILVALVRFGKFYQVQAQFGATCFAGVVIMTMIAARVFDPRLMWDRAAEPGKTVAPRPGAALRAR